MTIAMDSDLMPASMDLLHKALIILNIFPDQKECRTDVVFLQRV